MFRKGLIPAVAFLVSSLLLGGRTLAQEPPIMESGAAQISDQSRFTFADQRALNVALDRQLAYIESQTQLSQAIGEPTPSLFAAINQLRDMLPQSAQTRRMQAQGEVLQSLWPSGIVDDQTALALSAIDLQTRQDPLYQKALLILDKKLFPVNISHALMASSRQFPYGQLRGGDVMLWDKRGGGRLLEIGDFLYAKTFTHAALYLGTYGIDGAPFGVRRTYEAETPTSGVTSDRFDGRWDTRGTHVALGHVKNRTSLQALVTVIRAYNQFGNNGQTPYHLYPPWDKEYLANGLYCSQLVWVPYKQSGIDLDSNDWHYITWFALHNWWEPLAAQIAYYGVFPDELRASSSIDWYYDQVNP